MTSPLAPPNYASAQRAYRVALQNFRGLLGRQRAAQAQAARQALGTDPTDVARYAITGRAQLNVPTLVPASEQLTALAQQLMTQLSALVHSTLAVAPARCRLVVGLSGGADSALVLVLAARMAAQYGYQVQAVHCIHGLDPDNAIWLEHNQALCAQLGVALTTPQLNIGYGGGVSPEDASHLERYRAHLAFIKEVLPDCRVMDALSDFAYRDIGIDLPVVAIDACEPFFASGADIMVYYCTGQDRHFESFPLSFAYS